MVAERVAAACEVGPPCTMVMNGGLCPSGPR